MQKHCENAQLVAEYLENHPKVNGPLSGLKSHSNYQAGLKQHNGTGGMIAFELKDGLKAGDDELR